MVILLLGKIDIFGWHASKKATDEGSHPVNLAIVLFTFQVKKGEPHNCQISKIIITMGLSAYYLTSLFSVTVHSGDGP